MALSPLPDHFPNAGHLSNQDPLLAERAFHLVDRIRSYSNFFETNTIIRMFLYTPLGISREGVLCYIYIYFLHTPFCIQICVIKSLRQ
jgi:hypothetical protein